MPFDGVVAKCIVTELKEHLLGGRVEKIFQPEVDEIILTIRSKGQNLKLLLSASASYPRIHFTGVSKENPSAPHVFCMLLRKHLSGGRILDVMFHDYERIITINIESTNEMGDLSIKKLIIEIMGRYSNIILVNSENKIIDSIKHVDNETSSVREVMPARTYVLPPAQDKTSPDNLNFDDIIENAKELDNIGIEKHLLNTIKGFSPLLCREICYRAGIDGKLPASCTSERSLKSLESVFKSLNACVVNSNFTPCIAFEDISCEKPVDFHCLEMQQYGGIRLVPSMSEALDEFYCSKDKSERSRQKKSDILKIMNNGIDRCNKKLALQQEKLRDVSDRDKLKLYGELITANIYCMREGVNLISLPNYYSESLEPVEIHLDENLSPQANAQKYFKQYTKAKSAFVNTNRQLAETLKELEYLESVVQLLENCSTLQEIDEIRQELIEQGYMLQKKKGSPKKKSKASAPLHFKSSDGIDIYVGKNNMQNDYLTLKLASSNDIWLHARNMPGSHVVIKKLQHDIPDSTLLEGAILAAYHSKAKHSSGVPVDYTTVRNVKKPGGAKPGMVIYESFKTIMANPDEEVVKKLSVLKSGL